MKQPIYLLKNARETNGTQATILSLDELVNYLPAKTILKEDQPALCTTSTRGQFSPTNLFFIDIDSKEKVDEIINGRSELFKYSPNILFIQKSYSGKLHICCIIVTSPLLTTFWKFSLFKHK